MGRRSKLPAPITSTQLGMYSMILRTTGFFILPLLLLFSVFLLLRGHDEPGGGFIAGLVASAAFALHIFAVDARGARRMLRFQPRDLQGVGLVMALLAGILPLFNGDAFLTALWVTMQLPIIGELKLGSPLLFDIGVYLVVIGSVLTIILNLAEDND